MKKSLLFLFITIFTISCKKNISTDIKYTPENEEAKYPNPPIKNKDSIKEIFLNNKNELNSPVKILSSKLLDNQYSDHKDIQITYKNVTKKDIKAIKIEWYCENSFNKPANGKFFYIQVKSTAEITFLLKPGKTNSYIWEDFSTDVIKLLKQECIMSYLMTIPFGN